MLLYNPLEIFEIKVIKIFSFFFNYLNIYITDYNLYFIFICFIFLLFLLYLYIYSFIIPQTWQIILEDLYTFLFDCLINQTGYRGEQFFGFIFTVFCFILLCNLIGIVFYSYTITSQIIITFGLAFSAIVFIILVGILYKKIGFFLMFYPSGRLNFFMKIFLVIIEIISFLMRPFSLAIRLFANMLAGHTLLHILASFSFFISKKTIIFGFLTIIFIFLIGLLEVLIAFIQAYVYTILLCIFMNDSLADNH